MSEELTLESLELKKPLDKMTVKELRELVIDKIPQITGASGMDKETLVSAVKEVLGIEEEEAPVADKSEISNLKAKMAELRTAKAEATDKVARVRLRRKLNRMKKRTRRMATSA